MFKVGQKVVCVNPIAMLVKGEIYTVTNFVSCSCGSSYVSWGLSAHGVKERNCSNCNAEMDHSVYEYCVYSHRFRPIDYQYGTSIAEEIQQEINKEQLINI